jgi:hypothetical protein
LIDSGRRSGPNKLIGTELSPVSVYRIKITVAIPNITDFVKPPAALPVA